MSETIKFIHASDFHLDVPISGLTELPKHLVEVLANAPYEAAAKVFATAIAERVDFVLLAGDLFNLDAGNARAAAFLLRQFQLLADKGIEVYWVAGSCDHPDRWPASIELPANVNTFHSSIVERMEHRRGGKIIARIMAAGYDAKRKSGADFVAPDTDLFNIALSHGEFDTSTLTGQHIRYWALGGKHQSGKLEKPDTQIGYPGSPQGRHLEDTGRHGFKICRVDNAGKLRVQTMESDRVRFLPQKVAISEHSSLGEVKNELAERALKIITDTTDQIVLSSWLLSPDGEFNPGIRKPEWSNELLEWLRDEFGRSDKGLWSLSVTVEAPQQLPSEWYEEDTLLGEYMRAVGRYQSDESLKLNLHDYLPQTVKNEAISGMTEVLLNDRETILQQALMVGVEYLGKHKEYESEVDED